MSYPSSSYWGCTVYIICMNVPKNYVHIGRKEQKQNLKYVGCC